MEALLQVACALTLKPRQALVDRSKPEARVQWGRRAAPQWVRAMGESSTEPAQLAFQRPDALLSDGWDTLHAWPAGEVSARTRPRNILPESLQVSPNAVLVAPPS